MIRDCIKLRIESRGGLNAYDTLRSRVFLADITEDEGELKHLLSILDKNDEDIYKFRPVPPDETNRLKTLILTRIAFLFYKRGIFDEASLAIERSFAIKEQYAVKDDENYPALLEIRGLVHEALREEEDTRRSIDEFFKSIRIKVTTHDGRHGYVTEEITGREENILRFLKVIQMMIDLSLEYYCNREFEKAKLEINNAYHKLGLIFGMTSFEDIPDDDFDPKSWSRSMAITVGNVTLKLLKTFVKIEETNKFKSLHLMMNIHLGILRDELGDQTLFNW